VQVTFKAVSACHVLLLSNPLQSADHCLYVAACLHAQGVEYFQKEQDRVQRMIDSGSVAANKVDAFAAKVSVLSAFTEKPDAAAAAKDDDDDDEEL
jgi:hypothetical protein